MTSQAPRAVEAADVLSLDLEACAAALQDGVKNAKGAAMQLDPDTVEQDLAKLILALMEFLRQLMEAQAIRRMDAGRLTPEQEEKVGLTLMRARDRIVEIAQQFGLSEQDLTLRLGPLGRLV